ncbi:MAG: sigma-54-dependent Fis family transcriptional regulator [Bdellovibrionales bacterium]|nr:sigma-54-dependent Fis family transcriptional regulator [Bdellovibrionales bacterium]
MSTVLIVDDEIDIQSALSFALKDEGYDVLTASTPDEAEKILESTAVDIGLYDVWFPVGDGMELLKVTRTKYPESVIIMMSGHGNIELALNAIRLGAYDFLEKPLELEKILVTLRNAAEARALRDQNQHLIRQLMGSGRLIGEGTAIRSLQQNIERAAAASAHVLITGENGSGKELVARLLHQMSPRHDKPFITVNCAAIPEPLIEKELFGSERDALAPGEPRTVGRFEQAGKGTLFLDEISQLSPSAQAKLLRILEERAYERIGGRQMIHAEARVVAATNCDLAAEIKAGRFREDLFFRLNVLSIAVPPLRERRDDIPSLANHFLDVLSRDNGRVRPELRPELIAWMQSYDWPGNVRELRNLIERMLIMGRDQNSLGLADLPEELQSVGAPSGPVPSQSLINAPGTLRELRAQFEKFVLEDRLGKLGGNVTKAAESLGVERAHLHRKMKQYGLRGGEA